MLARFRQIVAFLVVALITPPCTIGQSADATIKAIRGAEKLAHSTALYRDCKSLELPSGSTDQIRDSWRQSYEFVRNYLREDNAQSLRHTFALESTLTHGQFTTEVNLNEALNNLNRSVVLVTPESLPSYSYEGSTAAIIVTTGLMSHICGALLPSDSFWTVEEQELRKTAFPVTLKHAEDNAHRIAAKFLVNGVRYGGIKLFVLGHETSHLLLDRYSGDLVAAKGYQEGNNDCLATFFLETRADIVGVAALMGVPIADKVDEPLRNSLNKLQPETVENIKKISIRKGVTDLLEIIDKEKEWKPSADSCARGAQQRRMELEHALNNLDKKSKPN
jgi:hypothetical protein